MVCRQPYYKYFLDLKFSHTDGQNMTLLEIQRTFKDEYHALGNEEREELVREYNENIDGTKHLTRPSPRGRIQDFSNTVRNLIMLRQA